MQNILRFHGMSENKQFKGGTRDEKATTKLEISSIVKAGYEIGRLHAGL